MNIPKMTHDEITAIWEKSPWGMAKVNKNGKIFALNPSFSACMNMDPSTLIGMSEADFDHLMNERLSIERYRIEVNGDNLLAVHYLRCAGCTKDQLSPDLRMSSIAELLREPLASIFGFSELLLTQNYDERTRLDLTEMLLGQAEIMANLINENLDSRTHQTLSNAVYMRENSK